LVAKYWERSARAIFALHPATAFTYETQYRAANDSVISVDMTKEYSRVACYDVGTPQRVHDMLAACHVTALA